MSTQLLSCLQPSQTQLLLPNDTASTQEAIFISHINKQPVGFCFIRQRKSLLHPKCVALTTGIHDENVTSVPCTPFHLLFIICGFVFGNRHFCSGLVFCLVVGVFLHGFKNLIPDLDKMGTKYQGTVKAHFSVFLVSWLLWSITQIRPFCKPDFGVQSPVQGTVMPPWHHEYYCMKFTTLIELQSLNLSGSTLVNRIEMH